MQIGFVDESVPRISPSDVLVGISGGRFTLWHSRDGRQIRLRESHLLYALRWAPNLIQFLTLLTNDRIISPNHMRWGPLNALPFLPRLTKGRLVLSPAFWLLDLAAFRSSADRFAWLQEFAQRWKMPQYCLFTQGDKTLPIKIDSPFAVETIDRASVGNEVAVIQEWFPNPESGWLKGGDSHYNAELVASFVRARNIEPSPRRPAIRFNRVDRQKLPSSDWTAVRIFCGQSQTDRVLEVLHNHISEVRKGPHFRKWFFVRYNAPRYHLRVRIQARDCDARGIIMAGIMQVCDEVIASGLADEYEFFTYNRELERYGGTASIPVVESIFHKNSELVIAAMASCKSDGERLKWSAYHAALVIQGLLTPTELGEWVRNQRRHYRLDTSERQFVRALAPLKQDRATRRFTREANLLARLEREGHLLVSRAEIISSVLHIHFNRFGIIDEEGRARAIAFALLASSTERRPASEEVTDREAVTVS